MTTFVCVHGAFRGGWAFGPVRRHLQRAGHDLFTPSLTGMGDRSHLRPADLGLSTWVTDVVSLIEQHDLRDVMLVGHSQGGLVITAASQQCHERLAGLVFLDAPEPLDGQRGVDLGPPVPMGVEAPPLPPRGTWLPPTPLTAESGLSNELVDWINERLCATPLAPSLDPVVMGDAAGAIERHRLVASQTPAGYPSAVTRQRHDREGVAYAVIDAPHDLIVSHPEAVANWLADLT